MITVLRRWFVPSDELEKFIQQWQSDIFPEIRRQAGCIRVEVYESSIREHWVTAVTWESDELRLQALAKLAHLRDRFAGYERFEPEILTLRFPRPDEMPLGPPTLV